MERTSFADMRCSLAQSLEIVGDWWSLLIIRDLFLGIARFDELIENLGISRNLLTRRLRWLIEAGIVERHAYQERPVRYDYALSRAGREVVPAVLALMAWGDRWTLPGIGAPITFRHAKCGGEFTAEVTCSCCGEKIASEDVIALPGPGGVSGPGTRVIARRLQAARRN